MTTGQELHNAVSLMRDSDLRDLIMACTVFQSRNVVQELTSTPSHAARLNMADACIRNPSAIADRMTNIIACDPEIAALGATAADVPEATIISKVGAMWTQLANMYFPASP